MKNRVTISDKTERDNIMISSDESSDLSSLYSEEENPTLPNNNLKSPVANAVVDETPVDLYEEDIGGYFGGDSPDLPRAGGTV